MTKSPASARQIDRRYGSWLPVVYVFTWNSGPAGTVSPPATIGIPTSDAATRVHQRSDISVLQSSETSSIACSPGLWRAPCGGLLPILARVDHPGDVAGDLSQAPQEQVF